MYTMTLISESVQAYCKRHEITLNELARRADVPIEEMSRIINGDKLSGVESASKIAKAMKCTLTQLLEKGQGK
jgi:transcriptional regulator with XRE-family HTH domain